MSSSSRSICRVSPVVSASMVMGNSGVPGGWSGDDAGSDPFNTSSRMAWKKSVGRTFSSSERARSKESCVVSRRASSSGETSGIDCFLVFLLFFFFFGISCFFAGFCFSPPFFSSMN